MTNFVNDVLHLSIFAFCLLGLSFLAMVAADFGPHAYRSVRKRIRREINIWKYLHRPHD